MTSPAAKPVAVTADITATAGTEMFDDATSGSWTPGPVTVTTHPRLRSGREPVAFRAVCVFVFAGFRGNDSVAGTETVTLAATGAAKLQRRGDGVLLDGDTAEGAFGNKLTASATGRLRTS